MEEFINIWTGVSENASLDQTARSAKLEMTIKGLLGRKGLPGDREVYNRDGGGSSCKAYVLWHPLYSGISLLQFLRVFPSTFNLFICHNITKLVKMCSIEHRTKFNRAWELYEVLARSVSRPWLN
jgi:hypothetical protein